MPDHPPRFVITELTLTPGTPPDLSCPHTPHIPKFDAEACRWLAPEQVREKYPRYNARCTACGQQAIIYASLQHFLEGGW